MFEKIYTDFLAIKLSLVDCCTSTWPMWMLSTAASMRMPCFQQQDGSKHPQDKSESSLLNKFHVGYFP